MTHQPVETSQPSCSSLVLSLFPGIGLMDAAFEDEGFCVVRGPDPLWEGAAISSHGCINYRYCTATKQRRPLPRKAHSHFENLKRLQGVPASFDLPGFTVAQKCKALANGVPLPMGRTIARAVREAVNSLRNR